MSCGVHQTTTNNTASEWDGIKDKFLFPVSTTSSSKYHLKRRVSKDSAYNEIYYKKKLLYKTSRASDFDYITEVFDESYLVISRSISKGASGPELIVRDLIYIIPLTDDTPLYKLVLEKPIQLTLHKHMIEIHWKNSPTLMHAIQDFTPSTLILTNNKLQHILVPLQKIEGVLIIGD